MKSESNYSRHILSGGTVNLLHLDPSTGVVSKRYLEGNGISGSSSQRLHAESISLEQIPCSPKLLGVDKGVLYMEHLSGESRLDEAVSYLPESGQDDIYRVAGKALRQVHSHFRDSCNGLYSSSQLKRSLSHLSSCREVLLSCGITTQQVIDYLHNNQDVVSRFVSELGVSWTHGDYWLNNLIGSLRTDRNFSLSGVIDWELASKASPYIDFASVFLSIEMPHPESSAPFWKGYGFTPNSMTVRYFAVSKMLDWLAHDPQADINSSFYSDKIRFMRQEVLK